MSELVKFYRKRLDEDEQWALAASIPYRYAVDNPPVPVGGVHWTWVVGENWEPVTPDPAVDEFVSIGDSWRCNLVTVEEWQTSNWMMSRSYAGTIEEMDASAAGHIVRHDPARVLRDVTAGREILAAYDDADQQIHTHHQRGESAPATLQHERMAWLMAIGYLAAAHSYDPDYQETWRV
jgi:hypothetical protein